KIFMPTLDFQDSEWASKESGTMTVRFNANSIGKNKRMIDYFSNNNDNIQEHIQQRAVLTPDEIGRPADNAATFFMPNTPVFQGHLVPYYEDPDLSSKFNSSRGIDFKLREKPIEFEDVVPEYVPSTPANQAPASTAQQTPEQIWAEVAEHKKQFAYEQADSISKEWWQSLEKLNEKNPIAVFNLSQQLVNRRLTLAEFYNFYATSGIDNVENLLQALDTKRLEQLRFALGWDLANQHAKDWWVSFEEANKNNIGTIMELGQELLKRAVSVDDFFSAYVHSDSSSVPDVLKVLDKMIEEKKQELEKNPPPIEDSSEDISGIGYTDVFGKDEDVADSYKTTQLDEEDVVDPFSLWEQGQGSTNRDSDYSANNNDSLSSKIEVLDDKVDSYDKETTDGISFDDLSGAGNGGGNSDFDEPYVTPREAKKKAVANVHVRSYIEMAEELIGQGKAGDIEKLIILAKDDEMFPNEFLADLENIKNNALGL
nr:type IV secretory system conjugative DNA transfer family protein [Pseudomonadota bacterium]